MTQQEFQVETGLAVHECITCGISFAMPTEFIEERRKDHESFHCPNGHKAYYSGKNEEEELRQKLEEAETCCQIYKNRERRRDYQKRYYKGQVTKLQKVQSR